MKSKPVRQPQTAIQFRTASIRSNASRGFSLVEVITALAISTLVLVVFMGLMTRLSTSRVALESEYKIFSWKSRLAKMLQLDFANSRAFLISSTGGQMSFVSCQSRSNDGSITQIPAVIVYEIKSFGDKNVMVRSEKRLIQESRQLINRAAICEGIQRIETTTRLDTDQSPPMVVLNFLMTDGRNWQLPLARFGGPQK